MKLDFPAGTVRHQKDDGTWVVAEPHHPLYSMATMVATEHWDEGERRWKSLDVAFEHCANEGAAALAEAERLRGGAAQRDDLLQPETEAHKPAMPLVFGSTEWLGLG